MSYPANSEGQPGGPQPGGAQPGGADDSSVTAFDRRVWPAIIIVGLVIVVLVNIGFIYVAVSGQDEVVPSYVTEPR